MGMPEIVFLFEQKARTLVKRSARGVVAMILEDATEGGAEIARIDAGDEVTGYTEANAKLIQIAFDSGATSVLAVRHTEDTLAETLAKLVNQRFNWLVFPDGTAEDVTAIVTWIEAQRGKGKFFKAVVSATTAPDSEGIVNFQGGNIKSSLFGDSTVTAPGKYCVRIAGILAGLSLEQSATYYVLDDIVSADESADPDGDVDDGKLIVVYDGEKYKLGRAVTSLTTLTDTSPVFQKIKHVESVDMMRQDMKDVFEDEYVGKIPNSYDNKQILVAYRNQYMDGLRGSVLNPDYENLCEIDAVAQKEYLESIGVDTSEMEEIDILKANTDSSVFLTENIQLLDAMEDLTLKTVLN